MWAKNLTRLYHWFRIRCSLHLLLVAAGVVCSWTLFGTADTVQAGAGNYESPEEQPLQGHGEFLDSGAVDVLIGRGRLSGSSRKDVRQKIEQLAPIAEQWEPEGYDPMAAWNDAEGGATDAASEWTGTMSDTDLLELLEDDTGSEEPASQAEDPAQTAPEQAQDTSLE